MTRIYPKEIAEAIYSASQGKSGKILEAAIERSVQIIASKHMLGKTTEILEALQNIFDKKSGVIRAKVTTSKKIGYELRSKIEEEIKKRYGVQKVVSEFFENKELLGGMRVEVGDEILDTTYRNKFNQLEKFLIQGQ